MPSKDQPHSVLIHAQKCAGIVAVVGAGLLAGCSSINSYLTPPDFSWTYKIDIQQGVVITQEMEAQLKPGQSRDQVRFILGTPLVTDVFHTNRWDYPYRFQPGRGPVELRHFTVYFENDHLARFEGDPVPTEREFILSRFKISAEQLQKALSPLSSTPATPPSAPGDAAPAAGTTQVMKATKAAPTPAPDVDPTAPSSPSSATPSTPPQTTSDSPSMWERVKGWFGSSSNSN